MPFRLETLFREIWSGPLPAAATRSRTDSPEYRCIMEPPETSLEEQLHRLATFFRATEPLAWRSVIRERAETRPREITSAPMLRERPPSRMDLPAFISRTVRAQINSAASKAARAISFWGTQVTVSSWPIPEQMEIPFSAILSARTPTPPRH